jgi:hypothetical protein
MDITRNWRLKISRSHLLAARNPETGAILLPHQTAQQTQDEVYTFAVEAVRSDEAEIGLARAAR